MQYGVTQEENWEGGGRFFLSLWKRKEGSQSKAEKAKPTEERWMVGEGLEQERCLLVGCGSLSGWIDLARVELHHLPCISLFFSQSGEVYSLRRARYFGGITATQKGYKITNSDEVSSLLLRGYTLLRRITEKVKGGN